MDDLHLTGSMEICTWISGIAARALTKADPVMLVRTLFENVSIYGYYKYISVQVVLEAKTFLLVLVDEFSGKNKYL